MAKKVVRKKVFKLSSIIKGSKVRKPVTEKLRNIKSNLAKVKKNLSKFPPSANKRRVEARLKKDIAMVKSLEKDVMAFNKRVKSRGMTKADELKIIFLNDKVEALGTSAVAGAGIGLLSGYLVPLSPIVAIGTYFAGLGVSISALKDLKKAQN